MIEFFKVGKEKKLYYGKITKINPNTYDVLFDDNEQLRMKKAEVKRKII